MITRHSREHKYNGLTYFIVPIADTKGVTVRPLIKITGETGFNEVLFEDVVVPDKLRVDDIGKGWTVAMTTLLYERGAAEGAGSGGGISLDERIMQLVSLARRSKRDGKPAWDDPIIRDRVAQLADLTAHTGSSPNDTDARAPSQAIAHVHQRIARELAAQIAEALDDKALQQAFRSSPLVRSIEGS